MKVISGVSDLLYSLYNYTSTSRINTETYIFASGLNFTIAMDVTTTANPTTSSATSAIYKFFVASDSAGNRALCIGKYSSAHDYLSVWWMASSGSDCTKITGTTAAAGRKRFIVTHEANSNSIIVYSKMATGSVSTQTITKTFTAMPTRTLYIGGPNSGTQQLPSGTISKFEIYNRIWTADERSAFFS